MEVPDATQRIGVDYSALFVSVKKKNADFSAVERCQAFKMDVMHHPKRDQWRETSSAITLDNAGKKDLNVFIYNNLKMLIDLKNN
jgi:hypothetical protein